MACLLWSVLAMAAAAAVGVEGRTWVVGDAQGWSVINYSAWSNGKLFTVGDELVFPYNQGVQDVAEVTQEDYEACNGKSPLRHWINGDTHIELTTPGSKYFISTFRCPQLRLAINVSASSESTTNMPRIADAKTLASMSPQQTSAPAPANTCVCNVTNNWNNSSNNPSSSDVAPLLHSLSFVPFLALTVWASSK